MKGVGTDILKVARVEAVVARTGDRFAQRILSETELKHPRAFQVRHLAKAFAAKEAVAKALGTGMRGGVGFNQISIERDPLGAPHVVLTGAAAQRLNALQGSEVLLSLSDESEYVLAFAVVS